VTTVTGGSPRQLVPVHDRNKDVRPIYVAWSSDGRNLYYLAVDPTDRASIWSISPVGGTPRLLVKFDDPQRPWHRFGFTAHDGRLYFTLGDLQSDLWMAEVAAGNEYRSR
jgi:hypothetical protein